MGSCKSATVTTSKHISLVLQSRVCMKEVKGDWWSPAQWKHWDPWREGRNYCATCQEHLAYEEEHVRSLKEGREEPEQPSKSRMRSRSRSPRHKSPEPTQLTCPMELRAVRGSLKCPPSADLHEEFASFEATVKAMVVEWRHRAFGKQQTRARDDNPGSACRPAPFYEIDFNTPKCYDMREATVTYLVCRQGSLSVSLSLFILIIGLSPCMTCTL